MVSWCDLQNESDEQSPNLRAPEAKASRASHNSERRRKHRRSESDDSSSPPKAASGRYRSRSADRHAPVSTNN